MAIDYAQLQDDITTLIKDLGVGETAAIEHLDGNQSRGYVVFSTTTTSDGSIPDVGTVQVTDRVAFISNVRNEICVGDKVTVNSIVYRVRETVKYKPARTNIAWRVVLDT